MARALATPAGSNNSYEEGTVIDITAIPDSGWQFDIWTGDVDDVGSANTTVTMDSDKTVSADFSQVKPGWWLISGIIAGVIIISVIVWWAVRSRMA